MSIYYCRTVHGVMAGGSGRCTVKCHEQRRPSQSSFTNIVASTKASRLGRAAALNGA